ncbi:MAG: Flp family type IVb pilin [Pseudomonas sp.]
MNTKLIMLMESLRTFVKREDGASAIEYALIAGLMAVIVIAAMAVLGGEDGALTGIFDAIAGKLNDTAGSVSGAE